MDHASCFPRLEDIAGEADPSLDIAPGDLRWRHAVGGDAERYLREPRPEVIECVGELRPLNLDRLLRLEPKSSELPFRRFCVIAFGSPVIEPSVEPELVLGVFDQFVDEACEKFARSAVNSSTCSRSQAIFGSA